jgi:hypothetical protein
VPESFEILRLPGETKLEFVVRKKKAQDDFNRLKEEAKKAEYIDPDSGFPFGLEDAALTLTDQTVFDDTFKWWLKNRPAEEAITKLTTKRPFPAMPFPKIENNMFRCPWPEHEDKDPDAWLNTEKKTWNCGPCGAGGDWIELAAAAFSYTHPGQKMSEKRADFPQLLAELKVLFGWVDPTEPNTLATETPPEQEEPEPPPPVKPIKATKPAPAKNGKVPVPGKSYSYYTEDDDKDYPTIDVDLIGLKPDTFLSMYFHETDKDDSPSEFGFICGLTALSLAIGRSLVLKDQPDVIANLAIVLTGTTTVGKSRAINHLVRLIRDTLPYDPMDPSVGIWVSKNPGSGEYLVKEFIVPDPGDKSKPPTKFCRITALIMYDEFSNAVSKSDIRGSSLKNQIMNVVDASDPLGTGAIGSGRLLAYGAFGALAATTQPEAAATLFTKEDIANGLLNRIIFANGRPKVKRAFPTDYVDLEAAGLELLSIRDWARGLPYIDWSDDARVLWTDIYENRITDLQLHDPTAMLGRLDLLLKKLMLLFAINDKSSKIMGNHVEQAAALIDYICHCFRVLSGKMLSSPEVDNEKKVLSYIAKFMKGGEEVSKWGPTARDITKHGFRSLLPTKQLLQILKSLEESEEIRSEVVKPISGKAGRPTRRYRKI